MKIHIWLGILALCFACSVRHARLDVPHPESNVDADQQATPRRFQLDVLDAETGEHLDDVILLDRGDEWAVPGERVLFDPFTTRRNNDFLLKSGVVSPTFVSPRRGKARRPVATYFVGRPGYAWTSLIADSCAGGERTVRLEQGANLDVDIGGGRVDRDCYVRLFSQSDDGPRFVGEQWARGTNRISFSGLKPGEYSALIQSGVGYESPRLSNEVEFALSAGRTKTITLVAKMPKSATPIPLRGRIVVPLEWGIDDFELSKSRVDPSSRYWSSSTNQAELSLLDARSGRWEFDFGLVLPGDYDLIFRQYARGLAYSWRIQVDAEARMPEHEVVLPAPASIIVRRYEADGEPASDTRELYWSATAESHSSFNSVSLDGPTQTYSFQVPMGEVRLRWFADQQWAAVDEVVQASHGLNEFEFTVEWPCRLAIRLLDGSTPVPLHPYSLIKVRAKGSSKPNMRTVSPDGYNGGFATLSFSRPGSYLLTLPLLEGFEPVPDLAVDLRRGEVVEHTVQLRRVMPGTEAGSSPHTR